MNTKGVTLHGSINPSDKQTTYHFEYGLTSAYGSTTADAQLSKLKAWQPVSAELAGSRRRPPTTTGSWRGTAAVRRTRPSEPTAASPRQLCRPTRRTPHHPVATPRATPPRQAILPAAGRASLTLFGPCWARALSSSPGAATSWCGAPATTRSFRWSAGRSSRSALGSTPAADRSPLRRRCPRGRPRRVTSEGDASSSSRASAATSTCTCADAHAPPRRTITAAGRNSVSGPAIAPAEPLVGRDHGGRSRTHRRNSHATVRGTRWLVEDRCDGTLTRVTRGKGRRPRHPPQEADRALRRRLLPRPRPPTRALASRPTTVAALSATDRRGGVPLLERHSGYAPGRIRTCDFCLRRAALYPLSYGRGCG